MKHVLQYDLALSFVILAMGYILSPLSLEAQSLQRPTQDPTQGGIIVLGPRGSNTHQFISNGEIPEERIDSEHALLLFNVGLGLQAGVAPKGNDRARFRLSQDVGVYPLGDLFLGVSFAENWGTIPIIDLNTGLVYDFNLFIFNFGIKVGYDITLFASNDISFRLTPSLMAGAAWFEESYSSGVVNVSQSSFYFNLMPSIELRLFLGKTFGLFLRPLEFDFVFPGTGSNPNVILTRDALASMNFMAGITLQF